MPDEGEEMPTQEKNKKQPKLNLSPGTPVHYANLVRITHSPSEFVLDYARMLPGLKEPDIVDRVLLSPQTAKLLFRALGENIAKYEARFGEIDLPGSSALAESLFRPPE